MKFVKPYIAKYGNARTVIQGNCGFGFENITLDKTGYYYNYVPRKFVDIKETCAITVCTTTITRGCRYDNYCNEPANC